MLNLVANQGRIYSEKVFAKKNVLLVGVAKIAFGEAEIINGIQHIGFTDSVVSYQAVYLSGKQKLSLWVVLKLEECKFG